MNQGFPYADLIFLALVAGFILLRLRSVLGKKIGHDPSMRMPKGERAERLVLLPDRNAETEEADKRKRELILAAIDNPAVSSGLMAIQLADAQFDLTKFLGGAKMAFDMVMDAFKKDDRDTLKQLLADEAYKHFEQELQRRAKTPEIEETTLVSIVSADIISAELERNIARITLKFVSEQIHVVRSVEGEILQGDPSREERVIDEWTFERDIRSRNPNWKIVTT